jgi:hypothetical protein
MDLVLLFLILVLIVFIIYMGDGNPIRRKVKTRVIGKRIRFQESITASGNSYVPVKSEVWVIDAEITFDIPVNKFQYDNLDSGSYVELNLHLNGTYSFRRKLS